MSVAEIPGDRPGERPVHLLSLEDWDALPEDTGGRSELVEGIHVVAPRPAALHQRMVGRIGALLDEQLPDQLTALQDVEVLISAGPPVTVRAPDVVVVPNAAAERNPTRWNPADVLLAVEVVSPGSRRTDRVTKTFEYADAGIPHYWIVELDPPVTLTGFVLVDGDYEEVVRTSGKVEVTSPAPLRLDVGALLDRR